nr:TPA_inf: conotoxin precursor T [Conus judaeus]
MLRLPIFILLLLALSPAASVPVERQLQRDLTRQSPKDFGMRNKHLPRVPWLRCLFKPGGWGGVRRQQMC